MKEFQFKFLHRFVMTKKELCRFGIKQESDSADIVEKKIPSITVSSTAVLHNLSSKM